MQSQIKIGPNFFRKEKDAYSNWRTATAREFLQNCLDARGTKHVFVSVCDVHDEVELVVENDGEPMTEDIIVNKLLSLGESGKDFVGTVGGFGLAKTLLYMSNLRYEIHSGDNLVVGSGGDYTLTKREFFKGTKSTVWFAQEDELSAKLTKAFVGLIALSQRPNVNFSVNGDPVEGNLKKGAHRRDFTWGSIYTNNSFPNRIVVRIGGIPMFTKYTSLDKCVVVELTGTSGNVLQSNRDGLKWEQQDQLDEFIRQLTVDKHTALRNTPVTEYIHYDGDRFVAREGRSNVAALINAAYEAVQEPVEIPEEGEQLAPGVAATVLAEIGHSEQHVESPSRVLIPVNEGIQLFDDMPKLPTISHEFVIKNQTGLSVPDHFRPESFSAYSSRLVKIWAATLLEIHRLFCNRDDFAVGFIFDDSREAEYETGGPYNTVYYLNPATIRTNTLNGGRSLAKRWKLTSAGKYALLMTAVHEFTHTQIQEHDEDYANALTTNAAVVLGNIKKFHRCFR